MNRLGRLYCFGVILFFLLTGCAAKVEHGFVFEDQSKIKVGSIKNNSNQNFKVDAESMLRSAVEKKLSDEKIFWDGSEKHFTLNLDIMDYEMGNAFKRWLSKNEIRSQDYYRACQDLSDGVFRDAQRQCGGPGRSGTQHRADYECG